LDWRTARVLLKLRPDNAIFRDEIEPARREGREASPTMLDICDRSALHIVASQNPGERGFSHRQQEEVISALMLAAGGDCPFLLNMQDNAGNTALDLAAKAGNMTLFQQLYHD